MKHFSYLVAIIVLLMVAVSLGFAAKGSAAKGVTSTGSQSFQQESRSAGQISDPEIRHASTKATRQAISSLKQQTSRPEPNLDKTTSITAGLSGTYHIPGDFPSIASAVAVLNFLGLSGNATFILDNTSYTENAGITFGAYPGNGTYTATVRPAAATAVTINFVPIGSEGKGFAFNGANNVTIDGLNTGGASLTLQYSGGVFPAGDAFAATIYVTNGSTNITVQNANIKGEIETATTFFDQTDGRPAVFSYYGASDAAANDNITITGCTITNATFGIKVLSDYTTDDPLVTGKITYSHNNVGGAFGGLVCHGGRAVQANPDGLAEA
jgi:hypothetical protein